ncbi:tyrosinase [Crassisporium funariophilum]|nr:tyrosinase [Crassisporium funariophilum]
MIPASPLLLAALLSLAAVLQTPALARTVHGPTMKVCKDLLERREWRTLNTDEKAEYIGAVKCLQQRPAFDLIYPEAVRTRFDEFQATHMTIADKVHHTGQFLPWHRRFLQIYETALRDECGYTGANPYWDWTQDAEEGKSLINAPVFDPITGFGGNGVPGTYTLPPDPVHASKLYNPEAFVGCVADGPFATYTLRLGPGKMVTDHCLVRGIDDKYKEFITSSAVANTTKSETYELFRIELEGATVTPTHKMHDGGHLAIGGDMSNFYSSPGDPLFYLHHANIDRVWWQWQLMNPSRMFEISGGSIPKPPFTPDVTLEYQLDTGRLGKPVPIRDVMNINREPNCYTYV